jgi:hypothetical protein
MTLTIERTHHRVVLGHVHPADRIAMGDLRVVPSRADTGVGVLGGRQGLDNAIFFCLKSMSST